MTRRTLTAVLSAALLTLAFASHARAQDERGAAARELMAGTRAYKDGRFAEAEQHFRRAHELDPSRKNAPLFIARAVQQQYKPGVQTPENVAAGERAAQAYQDILDREPRNEDAYQAIVAIYGQLKRDEKVVEMLTQRAYDYSATDAKRAEAFVTLASRQWMCSYDITERMYGRTKEQRQDGVLTPSHPTPDAGEIFNARQCADEGLRLVEQAVALNPGNQLALSYKGNILREHAKLARLEGDSEREADYERQYEEAADELKRTAAEAERKTRAGQKAPAPDATPEPTSDPAPATRP